MPQLLRALKKHWKEHKRDLPWRRTHDPYKILISEIMLQQTQVERVVPKYEAFIQKFPTPQVLARVPLMDVLALWQGLGYNRRARFLWLAAQAVVEKHKGVMPKDPESLETLPGIGHYTARAVAAFAHNHPGVFIETNIRTVFTHHCFPHKEIVSDKEILPLVEEALQKSRMQPRDFYAALMDYGSHLKRSGVKLNARSKHYTKQAKFKGSARQLRGAIVRELLKKPDTVSSLAKAVSRPVIEVSREVERLKKEGMVVQKGKTLRIGT